MWVDFNAMDGQSRVPLDFPGTTEDLARNRLTLEEGAAITLFTHDATDAGESDDLIAVGAVEWDAELGRWFARFDWAQLVHESELSAVDRELYKSCKRGRS